MTMWAPKSTEAKKKNMNNSSRRLSGDVLELIKEEEEEEEEMEGAVGGGDQLKGESMAAKMTKRSSAKITTAAPAKKRDWESGLKKVRSMVVNPINVLEAKYVQFMTGFAGRVGTRASPRLSSPRAVPVWQL